MERSERLIGIWNGEFPNFTLTVADLKKPHSMMGAYFEVFNRLGIDIDAVLSPPSEDEVDAHTIYYWDLLPVINMTRVINHVVLALRPVAEQELSYTITHFLQPDAATSHSMLLLLVNWIAFNEQRLIDISPHVSELFGKREMVKSLEEKKIQLLGLLNQQAEEKGKRAETLQKIDEDIEKFEEQQKQENEAYNEVNQELKTVEEEKMQLMTQLDQKKQHREALLAEIARKKALRVYDAEEIRATAEQSAQNVQEEQQKLDALQETLMQKENSLKNLQTIKPNLDQANTLLNEIMKLTETMKEVETGDMEPDSSEGELEVLRTELSELRGTLSELQAARAELAERRADHQARRLAPQTRAHSALREAEDKDKRCRERCTKSLHTIEELKDTTVKCEQEKASRLEEIEQIKQGFEIELTSFEQVMVRKVEEAEQELRNKVKRQ